MALSDALAEITPRSIATKNRVDILLEQLEGSEDHGVLLDALHNSRISSAALTRALLKEYGPQAVKELSVATWRRNNSADVNGL